MTGGTGPAPIPGDGTRGRRPVIAVIGSGDDPDDATLAAAETVGRLVAQRGGAVVTGGRGGIMEAASRGASAAGGLVIGVLPGTDGDDANAWVDIAIPTGLGFALRNVITVRTADAVIMVNGEVGTLAEAVLCYQHGKPLVCIASTGGWAARLRTAALEDGRYLDNRRLMEITYSGTAEAAVEAAFARIGTVPRPGKI